MRPADSRKQSPSSARRPVATSAMTDQPITARGLILACLKEAYMRRLKRERLGSTPRLTQELDLLELAITDITEQINESEPK